MSLMSSFTLLGITDKIGRYILPPQYTGRRMFHGSVEQSQTTELRAKVWIHHPGMYSLNGWIVKSEVGDRQEDGMWKTRH